MNILVTGGAGYIGSVVSRWLLSSPCNVRVMDSLLYGGNQLLHFCDQIEFILGDVRHKSDCRRAVKDIDCVVHLAAIVGEAACNHRGFAYSYDTNVMGTQNLYIAAHNAGVPSFIFASTCSNYGASDWATEETDLQPTNDYARQKVEAEEWLKFQGDATTLRFATAFGFSPRMRKDLMIQEFVFDALREKELRLYNPGAGRPFVHVKDIARVVDEMVWSSPWRIAGQVYNVGGINITKRELADLINDVISVRITEVKKGDARDYKVSFEKIQKEFSFEAMYDIHGFIVQLVDAWQKGIFSDTVYINSSH
ncbi:MAG: NAD-dependent epimerase/dehydratase family protein [Candidatus Thorarchaeota archaeon]